MSLFLLLLMESNHFGGFYLLYILMALPSGAAFSLVAVFGLSLLFIGYKIYRRKIHPLKPLLYLLGYGLLIVSLFLFFTKKDRLETFEQTIPVATFILFAICSLCFLVHCANLFLKCWDRNDNKVTTFA